MNHEQSVGSKLLPLLTWRAAIVQTDLPATTKLVALALSLYMGERGDSAHPGASRLAKETSLSERSVRAQLHDLIVQGWLVLVEQGGVKGERRRANVYQARIPQPLNLVHGNKRTPESDDINPCISRHQPMNQVHPISSMNSSENSWGASGSGVVDCEVCGGDGWTLSEMADGRPGPAVKCICTKTKAGK